MSGKMIVVLVHGWSVDSTQTYGELPQRLTDEADDEVDVRHIWLGRYVSFKDEVRVEDLSRGFQAALKDELKNEIAAGRKIACITHSTGGPVVRDWWDRFYIRNNVSCPVSHLIMLAPANYGSALAQLGKGRLSRLRSAMNSVEPGQGILDWLELGSPESWDLNARWIQEYSDPSAADDPVFLFSLSGQSIDREFYDYLNSYTGELGSDGTVRLAAANLNSTYLRLEQSVPVKDNADPSRDLMVVNGYSARELIYDKHMIKSAPRTAFGIIRGRSHTGKDDGILYSIKKTGRHPTVSAILHCLNVKTKKDYDRICDKFDEDNKKIRESERVEIYRRPFVGDPRYIHDSMSMVIIRVRDDQGHRLDYDVVFTGPRNNPDLLPDGFFQDRQRNSRDRGTMTFFVNHDLAHGSPEIIDPRKEGGILREEVSPLQALGLQITPRPREQSYVHYLIARLRATKDHLEAVLRPDETTLIDIVMRRCVREGVHRIGTTPVDDFRDQKYGGLIDF